jgi:5-methylcytosine-specific restriction endonuclease McrA
VASSDSTTKSCCRCKQSFPRTPEHFEARPTTRDGLRGACRECERARKSKLYFENKDHYRQLERDWVDKNRERKNELAREDYRSHKIKRKATKKKWKVGNRALLSVYDAKRRTARKANGGSHTADDVMLQYRSQNGLCWWCGVSVGTDYHVDHRVPIDRGGSNDARNICITCPYCNLSKKNKLPHEWSNRLL